MTDGSKLLQNEVIIVQLGLPPGGTYVFHDNLEPVLIRVWGVRGVSSATLSRTSCTYDADWRYALPEDELVDFEPELLEAYVIEQIDIMAPGSRRI